jgi:hypothetical protein
MSLTYLTIADMRSINQPQGKLNSILKTLNSHWNNSENSTSLDPPYIESIAGHFSANIMRVSEKFSGTTELGHSPPAKQIKQARE